MVTLADRWTPWMRGGHPGCEVDALTETKTIKTNICNKSVLCGIELSLFLNNGIHCIFRKKQKDAEITPFRSRNHDSDSA